MHYIGAYRFFFENPRWPRLLLIGTICMFVPVAGLLALMGYIYTVIEAKHRHGQSSFPDFDLDRIGTYIVRGLWPVLVSLVTTIPLLMVAIPGFMILMFFLISASTNNTLPPVAIVLIPTAIAGFTFLSVLIHFLSLPMILRAGLSQEFGSAFSWTYVRDFLGRVWLEMLLSLLFLMVSSLVVSFAGLLLLIVGMYPAMVVISFAQFHFHYQLYELYLQRGGTPIPLKDA